MYIPYDRSLKERSRDLRKNQTKAEEILWNQLRGRRFHGYKFTRQKPLLGYIVDFYCAELRLAIEVDGSSHAGSKVEYDLQRTKELNNCGIYIKRYTNFEVENSLKLVLDNLAEYLKVYAKIRNVSRETI